MWTFGPIGKEVDLLLYDHGSKDDRKLVGVWKGEKPSAHGKLLSFWSGFFAKDGRKGSKHPNIIENL